MNVHELQRYEMTEHSHGLGHMAYYDKSMDADPDGEFVKFADVAAMLAATPAAIVQAEPSEADKLDAERYRWLRVQEWFTSPICVLRYPQRVLARGAGSGADCPSHHRLDDAIDTLRGAK